MPVPSDHILAQLTKILAGSTFETASRSKALLQFVVLETLAGRADQVKEYTIGLAALGRAENFDPRTDPIVRAEASRLRTKLEAYYAREGTEDAVEILLPRGTYVPQFSMRNDKPAAEADPAATSTKAPLGVSRLQLPLLASVGAVAVLAGAFFASKDLGWFQNRQPKPQPIFLDLELRTTGTVASQAGPDFAISPDGTKIVFIAISKEGTPRLHLKRLDRFENTVLEGTEGARVPFFSPDGSSVGFWAASKLKKTFLGGGAPVVLCDATDLLGGSWGDDGFIVAAIERQKLSRVPAAGGQPEVILDLSMEARVAAWPQVLPGGKGIVFTSIGFDGADRARIEVLRPATGTRSTLATGATHGRILSDTWLIYTNQSAIYAQPLEAGQLRAAGQPIPTTLRVPYSATFGYAQYDLAPSGTLLYRRTSGLSEPHWIQEGTEPGASLLEPGRYVHPVVSRDGSRIAITETVSGLTRVLIRNAAGDIVTRLPAPAQFPLWSPNGEFLILGSLPNLAWVRADGSGGIQPLTNSSALQMPGSFSPDGKTLVYAQYDQRRGFDLWTLPVQRSREGLAAGTPSPFLQTPAFETHPSLSPDGKWISYASNESGVWEVYVRAFPDNGSKLKVSPNGGRISRWSHSKQELMFRTDSMRLMVAAYSLSGGKMVIKSVREFPAPRLVDTGVLANFDLAPDGRVLAILPASSTDQEQSPNHVSLVINFLTELDRLEKRRELP